ncbi:uncharacterized protein LOC143916776 [Arctopsyche grandis]|uniref:uncharacterized protein LOC143916776 n=1 Tax=Arctopsyche grandis TaxID=121162 RepID=UPI00406D938D
MSETDDMESIEKEIRELILHSKSKRTTVFEPCNENNLAEYLTYIQEELTLYGVKYRFNPFDDLAGSENTVQAMVRLVNAVWNLLMQHKEITSNADKLKERNYALQQNNFFLNSLVEKSKSDLDLMRNKRKQADENVRQVIFKYECCKKELAKVTEEVKRTKKQMDSKENQLTKTVKKMEQDYLQLQDRSRGQCGVFVSKVEAKHAYIAEFQAKEKKYKETIAKLQEGNRQLLLEVVSLKDDLLGSDRDA